MNSQWQITKPLRFGPFPTTTAWIIFVYKSTVGCVLFLTYSMVPSEQNGLAKAVALRDQLAHMFCN